MDKQALVLGATGSFGGAVALELLRRGWRVRALLRDAARLKRLGGAAGAIEPLIGDALNFDDVARAAQGCAVLVHGVNYPYPEWVPNMERVTANALRAARQAGALFVFPGNVYGFGLQEGAALDERAGMRPNSNKGRLRVKLETAIKAATQDGKCRALIVRAGDYFGPTVRNGYVDRVFGNAVSGKPMQILGRLDIAHQWAYVPDLARLGVDLIERPMRLAPFEVVHFRGTVADPQRAFLHGVAVAAGKPSLGISVLPWPLIWLLGRFGALMREVYDMRYLFDHAIIIDDRRARALVPDFTATPLERAIAETLASYRSP